MKKVLVLVLLIVLSACKGSEGSGGETLVTRQLDEPVRENKLVDRSKDWSYEEAQSEYYAAHQEEWAEAFANQQAAGHEEGYYDYQKQGGE